MPELDSVYPVDQLVRSIPEMILKEQISRHVAGMTVIRNACVEKYVHS